MHFIYKTLEVGFGESYKSFEGKYENVPIGFNNPATDSSLFPFKHMITCVSKKEETPLYMNGKPLNLSKSRITLLSLQAFDKKGNPICILVKLKEIRRIYGRDGTLA